MFGIKLLGEKMKGNILVVDDEAVLRQLLKTVLQFEYNVTEAASAVTLRKLFPHAAPDLVLLDLKLPDANGLDLILPIRQAWPDTEIIVLTGQATFEAAVQATKCGAYHFIKKPFDNHALLVTIDRALENQRQKAENNSLRRALTTMSSGTTPVFQSGVMKTVLHTIERVAPSPVAVLITGESGTGKEVVADLIHALSPRASKLLVKVNCAALPRELIESELFGSVKGAFTGAHADHGGLFRQAAGGTLFLDEISEMPVDTQSKLLRVLQDQKVRPVGGTSDYQTDCRILAATNRRPEDAIKDGRLREDLFYRISAITVHLPPLRERRDAVLPLANLFLKRYAAQANRELRGFSPEAVERLIGFNWPGNVRQLQNEIQRAVLLSEGSEITAADLSISAAKAADTNADFTLLEGVERNTILQMLKQTNGNKLETAKRLGIGRQTLYNKIKAYGIEV